MGFITDVQQPPATAISSTTASISIGLTIAPVAGQSIYLTGFTFGATLPTAANAVHSIYQSNASGTLLYRVFASQGASPAVFPASPIRFPTGVGVFLENRSNTAGSTTVINAQYYVR